MKTVIEMAREADACSAARVEWDYEWAEHFAELVRADEREACAKVCDEAASKALALQSGGDDLSCIILRHHAVAHLADAAAIQARGQA